MTFNKLTEIVTNCNELYDWLQDIYLQIDLRISFRSDNVKINVYNTYFVNIANPYSPSTTIFSDKTLDEVSSKIMESESFKELLQHCKRSIKKLHEQAEMHRTTILNIEKNVSYFDNLEVK